MNRESMIQCQSHSVDQTMQIGRRLAEWVRPGDVIALDGMLGAGKTQLVRGLASGMGASDGDVSSPTFVMVCEYPTPLPLVHIDAYRMNGLSDLESVGWSSELLADAVTVIEWADRIAAELPEDRLSIRLEHVDADTRAVEIEPAGSWVKRLEMLSGVRSTVERSCPSCKKTVELESPSFPFCSKRCRLVDLNRWFDGDYSIDRPMEENDFEA